jgi:hypothetical protein
MWVSDRRLPSLRTFLTAASKPKFRSGDFPMELRRTSRNEWNYRPKPKNESKIKPITAKSVTVTGVTGGFEQSPSLTPDDYLGPPDDNPNDFLGDIPDFLRRT